MKNIVIGICSVVLAGILILIVFTIQGRVLRQTELNNALGSALKNTLERQRGNSGYQAKSNEELTAIFIEEFFVQLESHGEIEINILDADWEKCLLSVEVVESFLHPSGREGKISARQTVILESYALTEKTEYCTLQYLVEGDVYKIYKLPKDSQVIVPTDPVKEGKVFEGWSRMGEDEIITLAKEKLETDSSFVAVFR